MTARLSSWIIFLYLITGTLTLINTAFSSNNFSSGYVQLGILALMFVNCLGVLHANKNCIGLALFYALISYVFIFTRIAVLSFSPEEARWFGEELQYTSSEIANTIYYIAGFSGFFYLGLVPFKRKRAAAVTPSSELLSNLVKANFKKILLIGLIPIVLKIISYTLLAVGRGGETSILYAITNFAFNHDIFTLITLALVALVWTEINSINRWFFIVWICLFILAGVISGGKGSIYTLALCSFFILLIKGDFNIRLTTSRLFLFLIIGFFSMIMFVVADGIRYAGYANQGLALSVNETISLGIDYISLDEVKLALSAIGRRLSHFEYIAIIVNNTGDFQRDLINPIQSLQVFANFILLGSPFPDEKIYSLQLFKVAYYGFPLEWVLIGKGPHGDYIPLPGLVFLLFGPLSGLLYAFGLGVFSRLAYIFICNTRYRYSYLYILCFWFIYSTLVNDSFGLDHFLQKTTIYLFSLLTFILLFKLFTTKLRVS